MFAYILGLFILFFTGWTIGAMVENERRSSGVSIGGIALLILLFVGTIGFFIVFFANLH